MALRSTTRMRPVDRIRVRDEGRLDLGSWILEASWCQILHDARCRSPQSDPDPLAATLLHPTGEFYQKNVSRSDSDAREGLGVSNRLLLPPREEVDSGRSGK